MYLDEDKELDKLFQLPENVLELPKIFDLSRIAFDLYSKIHEKTLSAEISSTPGDFLDKLIAFEYKIYKNTRLRFIPVFWQNHQNRKFIQ
jgi:hypothetical protein